MNINIHVRVFIYQYKNTRHTLIYNINKHEFLTRSIVINRSDNNILN